MTIEQLQEILNLPPAEAVGKLQKSDISIPDWKTELLPQYDAMQHAILTDFTRYPLKLRDGADDFRRIPIAKQKEAVNKMAQSMFFQDVIRKYDIDKDDAPLQEAKEAFETNYKNENSVDSLNMERAKELYKCCQVATVWKLEANPSIIKDKVSQFSLTHTLYSPALGYELYPYLAAGDRLLGISIAWTEAGSGSKKMNTYVPGAVISYANEGEGWQQIDFHQTGTERIPIIFSFIDEPVWGGDSGTKLVEILEEILSKQQMYIDKNTVPTYVLYRGKGGRVVKVEEKADDARRVITVGEDGFMKAIEWGGAKDAIAWQYHTIEEQFYQQTQVFNNSPSAMSKTPLSADNKEILLFDSKAKAKDLSGEYAIMLLEEFEVVKWLMSIQFPVWATALERLNCRSIITPYSVRSLKDRVDTIVSAKNAGVISLQQSVEELDLVDNVENEVELILEEQNREANNFL